MENIPFIRMEASTNLIGGQPFSISNLMDVRRVADKYGIMLVLDASLLGENAYLVKQREEQWKENSMADIIKMMTGLADLVYFSARKLSSSRGGGICTNRRDLYSKMEALIPLYEGFLTYGGISVREIEAMTVGLRETLDETMISQSPNFIKYLVETLDKHGVPVVTPPGVLGAHVDAMSFCSHIPQTEYPAGALAAALYLISGIRGMERGTVSSVRDENGDEIELKEDDDDDAVYGPGVRPELAEEDLVFDDGAPGKSVDEDEANDNGFEVQDEDDVFGLLDDYTTDDASEDEN